MQVTVTLLSRNYRSVPLSKTNQQPFRNGGAGMAKAFRTSARLDWIARAQYLPGGMRYLLAALVTAAALLLRLALGRFIGPHTPFSTMYPAIAFSALFLGIGPSLMCTLAGLVAVKIFFLLPGRPFLTALDLELSAAYLVMAALFILVGEISNRGRLRAERAERPERVSVSGWLA